MQLKPADILKARCNRGSLQKCREPLAAADVAALRAHTELARAHVFDHTLSQRGDSRGCHRQLLSWMRFITLHHQDRALPPLPTMHSPLGISTQDEPHLSAIA